MAKVIPFSRQFPSYHPEKGKPTFFIEKILNELGIDYRSENYLQDLVVLNPNLDYKGLVNFQKSLGLDCVWKKKHTIRGGSRFKDGELFSPRIWTSTPYRSSQLIFWYDLPVKRTYKFDMDENGVYSINRKYTDTDTEGMVFYNDGLTEYEFFNWFMPDYNKPKPFYGQIICFGDVKY